MQGFRRFRCPAFSRVIRSNSGLMGPHGTERMSTQPSVSSRCLARRASPSEGWPARVTSGCKVAGVP